MFQRLPLSLISIACLIAAPLTARAAPVTNLPPAKVSTPYADARNDCTVVGGTADNSANMAACATKAKAIELPEGALPVNVLGVSGETVRGAGAGPRTSGYGAPSTNYLEPYDHTKEVLKVGTDTVTVAGGYYDRLDIRGDISGDGGGAAPNCVTFGGGAYDTTLANSRISGCTGYQVGLIGGNVKSCAHQRLSNLVLQANGGSIGLKVTDPNSATVGPNYTFCNDHFGERIYALTDNTSTGLYVDSAWLYLNWKSDGYRGFVFKNTVAMPVVHCPWCNFDNAGQGSAGQTGVYDTGQSIYQSAGFSQVFDGDVQIHGSALVVAAKPTITVAQGSNTVTFSSTSGVFAGSIVSVAGATSIWNFRVLAVTSSTTATIDGSCTNTSAPNWSCPNATAPYSETNAAVYVGDDLTPAQIKSLAMRSWYDPQACSPAPRSIEPIITQSGGCSGAPAPFSGFNWLFQLGSAKTFFLQDVKTEVTPSTLSLTGGVIDVGYGGANAHVGDIFCIHGTNEAGFYGCYALAAESTNSFDYLLPVSGSPPNVTAATGSPKITIIHTGMYMSGGTLNFGIGHPPTISTIAYGTWTPLSACGNGGAICIAPPDGSGSGDVLLQFGHSVWQTANTAVSVQDYTNYKNQSWAVNGGGGEILCNVSGYGNNPTAKPSVYLCDTKGNISQSVNAGDGWYFAWGGLPYFKRGDVAGVPLQAIQSGVSTARPTSYISGYSSFVAGSGGTAGTFSLSFSGGTCTTNPAGTFVVAIGVVTAITITSGGQCTAAPTASFSASSGLTGATVNLTVTNLPVGTMFFDTTLGKPVWLKTSPSTWVDATGATV